MENRVFTLKVKVGDVASITEHAHISQLMMNGFEVEHLSTSVVPMDTKQDRLYITVIMKKK